MKRKTYYPTSMSLNEIDVKRTERLKSLGHKIINIFREGLTHVEKKHKKT